MAKGVPVHVFQSGTFRTWLADLRDRQAARRIAIRIERLAYGNPGDHHGVGGGVMELVLTYGPGYQVYHKHRGATVVVLLASGDKSTQSSDIAKAQDLATEMEGSSGGEFHPL